MNGADQIEKIDPDYLSMPDDEIMGMAAPAVASTPAATEEVPSGSGEATDPVTSPQAGAGEPAAADANTGKTEAGGQNDGGAAAGGTGEDGVVEADASSQSAVDGKPADDKTPDPTKSPAAGDGVSPVEKPVAAGSAGDGKDGKDDKTPATPAVVETSAKALGDYTPEEKAAAFDQILKPFKANDRMIELRSPEEAVKLMQMGANYTKKLQMLQPHLRATRMLENNGLLDENKLSFVIDLMKGDPLAIQKLLADSQFDPMTVDKDKAADYTPGNHQVSEAEMLFQSALDELETTDTGKELIQEVAQWDTESKKALFQHPEVLTSLNQQRELGLYEQINSEVQRLQTLGQIPQGTPYLQAYRAVGDMLHAQGRLKSKAEAPTAVVTEQPVETRIATPPAQVTNNEQASRAALTKTSPVAATTTGDDILGEADDKFLARMQGRL